MICGVSCPHARRPARIRPWIANWRRTCRAARPSLAEECAAALAPALGRGCMEQGSAGASSKWGGWLSPRPEGFFLHFHHCTCPWYQGMCAEFGRQIHNLLVLEAVTEVSCRVLRRRPNTVVCESFLNEEFLSRDAISPKFLGALSPHPFSGLRDKELFYTTYAGNGSSSSHLACRRGGKQPLPVFCFAET